MNKTILFSFVIIVCFKQNKAQKILPENYSVDDVTEYNEEEEKRMANPECSMAKFCHSDQNSFKTQMKNSKQCECRVNCYEFKNFPSSIPRRTTSLTVEESFFKKLHHYDLRGLPNLIEVAIEYNELQQVEEGVFKDNSLLQSLRLHGNKLQKLPSKLFNRLSKLDVIDLSRNNISHLHPMIFFDLVSLKTIDLSFNPLRSLGDRVFRKLKNLKTLLLKGNKITFVSPSAFTGLHRLQTLNLEGNMLTAIPSESVNNLRMLSTLNIGRNPIYSLKRIHRLKLVALRNLKLNNCQIRDVDEFAFEGMRLKTLDLSGNYLSTLPVIGKMGSIESIKFENNPWKCDCHIMSLVKWLFHHQLNEVSIICKKPMSMEEKDLMNLSEEEIFTFKQDIVSKCLNIRNKNATHRISHLDTNQTSNSYNKYPHDNSFSHFSIFNNLTSNYIMSKPLDVQNITLQGYIQETINITSTGFKENEQNNMLEIFKSTFYDLKMILAIFFVLIAVGLVLCFFKRITWCLTQKEKEHSSQESSFENKFMCPLVGSKYKYDLIKAKSEFSRKQENEKFNFRFNALVSSFQ